MYRVTLMKTRFVHLACLRYTCVYTYKAITIKLKTFSNFKFDVVKQSSAFTLCYLTNLRHKVNKVQKLGSFGSAMPSAIMGMFSEFLMFCNLITKYSIIIRKY